MFEAGTADSCLASTVLGASITFVVTAVCAVLAALAVHKFKTDIQKPSPLPSIVITDEPPVSQTSRLTHEMSKNTSISFPKSRDDFKSEPSLDTDELEGLDIDVITASGISIGSRSGSYYTIVEEDDYDYDDHNGDDYYYYEDDDYDEDDDYYYDDDDDDIDDEYVYVL